MVAEIPRDIVTDPEHVFIGPRKIAVWPKGQAIDTIAPPIAMTRFSDTDQYHPALMKKILAVEATLRQTSPPNTRCLGGQKIHKAELDTWNCPELDLVRERAKALFKRTTGAAEAHVDGFWANVYRQWESIGPHCHRRAMASFVYSLDTGDEDPDCDLSGRLAIVDPRLDACCQFEKGHMTHPMVPKMTPGTLLIFPGYVLHAVHAYSGVSPRITLALNINDRVLPGKMSDAFAPGAPGQG